MTREQFLATFQKHLRVAEPKRSEIITELQTHLDDVGSNLRELGDPGRLARHYDATHVGPWAAGPWLYMTPVLLILGFLPVRYTLMSILSYHRYWDSTAPFFYLQFLMPFIGALVTGLSLARMKQPGRHAIVLIVLTFLTINTVGLIGYRPEWGDRESEVFLFEYMLALFQMLFLIGFATLAYTMERSWWGKKPTRRRA